MDVYIRNTGSIILLEPQNDTARGWVAENIGEQNGFQPYWPTVVCEARYASDIIEGMREDGLQVGP